MLDQLIVVDYYEGSGGEFIANWLSAHFGQKLQTDQQANPNYLQKWLNSHSLVYSDWQKNFNNYLLDFNKECDTRGIQRVAVSYHLYKYPEHVEILKQVNQARFVRINCAGHKEKVTDDFNRKVLDRLLGSDDFAEIKFVLHGQSQEKIKEFLNLYRYNKLTYRDLISCKHQFEPLGLPSDDVEIMYGDFFVAFDRTPDAYQHLCKQLNLTPNLELLDALTKRNKKNLLPAKTI